MGRAKKANKLQGDVRVYPIDFVDELPGVIWFRHSRKTLRVDLRFQSERRLWLAGLHIVKISAPPRRSPFLLAQEIHHTMYGTYRTLARPGDRALDIVREQMRKEKVQVLLIRSAERFLPDTQSRSAMADIALSRKLFDFLADKGLVVVMTGEFPGALLRAFERPNLPFLDS